ncbi:helix-turn-helix transcriptional regulator [Flavihumibacter sp. R14]|nr:helix-turn-helix transcriptional regulator [Flavihumibacter soli]
MDNTEDIQNIFFDLFEQQTFVEAELDYSILDNHRPLLQNLADTGNSIVSVLDVYKKQHVFYSSNFGAVLGYSSHEVEQYGDHFMNAKVHPEDLLLLMENGLTGFKLYLNFSKEEKVNYKMINEFRILNASNQYIRVIEQHQTLELDKRGNLWLALSILDISPNQDLSEGLKSQLLNFRTGKFLSVIPGAPEFKLSLTKREAEILKLVKEGFLSKEISDRLSISIHTVNTHRQRVLEKLGANNSMEAVVFSSKLGLV